VTVHPEWPGGYFAFDSPVTIKLKDGRELKKVCANARGDPSKRLGSEEVMKKYLDCINFAGIFTQKTAEKAAEITLKLDKVEDVTELISMLTYPDRSAT